ncbi:PTH1 family peptidyl-tRNA hydrolase [Oikeobacillus pervagus]|uniref:Peptidyl-tRNA hydrolase n=1 Tax=Oikeobacillus pervagus TaxID=1325931 RepID=A0AAJ1WJZ8_9BACI|nr:aminoacyl-tRNA hydrolase [Oikeobacillus pervagus]MDQ0216195.1 PTH1 family peptidyl-tRNA hydrolase [Oikeobacillus pervagus]
MKLLVGLGNPGPRFDGTRHNIGFEVIDELASRFGVTLNQAKHKGIYSSIQKGTEKLILLKPLTYMNLSGESIGEVMRYYKIETKDLLIIYDDLDLPVGKIRLRQKGSAGGHNGIKSTIAHVGTQNFNRIRIGVDRPKGDIPVPDYVLGKFSKEERVMMNEMVQKSADACEAWIEQPFIEVMNEFNK